MTHYPVRRRNFISSDDVERTPRHAKIIEKAFSSNRAFETHYRIFDNILPEINFVITESTKERKREREKAREREREKKLYSPYVTANKTLSRYRAMLSNRLRYIIRFRVTSSFFTI